MIEYLAHTYMDPSNPVPACGVTDPGPIPLGEPIKILACAACAAVGGASLPEKMTMRYHLVEVRESLRQKMRGMSEADRTAWKESVLSIASAGLRDPTAAPALYDEGQLLAALYAIGGIRAGFWQLRRAGVRPTWSTLEQSLLEHEMITVALVEGTPL